MHFRNCEALSVGVAQNFNEAHVLNTVLFFAQLDARIELRTTEVVLKLLEPGSMKPTPQHVKAI